MTNYKHPRTVEESAALLQAIEKAGGLRPFARKAKRAHTTIHRWQKAARRLIEGNLRPKTSKLLRDKKQRELIEFLGGRCELCKQVFPPAAYDFHHKNPAEKEYSISREINGDIDKLKKEATKCALLCANCHRVAHYVRNNFFVD